MAILEVNRRRYAAILLSRSYKDLFLSLVPARRLYRSLFRGDNGGMHTVGEHVLADLRDFCGASRPTIFDTDPLIMARREGRREVFVRIVNMLNLDENAVQKLMELDHGLGE